MSIWPSCKARKVRKALKRIGWDDDPSDSKGSSHIQLKHKDFAEEYTWAFHNSDEIGPVMMARIAKKTGLKPSDL